MLRFTIISFGICIVFNFVLIGRIHANYKKIISEYREEIEKHVKTPRDLIIELRFELCNSSVFVIDAAMELFQIIVIAVFLLRIVRRRRENLAMD